MIKIYALVALLVLGTVDSISALSSNWRQDIKINHMQQVNDIVNRNLASISSSANAKGTAAAKQCLEDARLSLRSATQSGYSEISSCVSSASTAGIASVCCQQAVSKVFNISLDVSSVSRTCISNA